MVFHLICIRLTCHLCLMIMVTISRKTVIEPYQVERKLAHLNPHKAGGPDEIPNWFWRDFSAWLAEPLCCIFNYTSGCVPFHVETDKCHSST